MSKAIGILFYAFVLLSVQTKENRFSWDEKNSLTWSDFKAVPDANSVFAATSNTGISHSYTIAHNGYLVKSASKVKANFYPNLSWYVPKLINKNTLAHEQAHFDISEVHARMLRKAIVEFRFTRNSKAEIKKIYSTIEKSRKEMQGRFDKETQHSVNRELEVKWEDYVAKLLYKYRNWSE